MTHEEHKTLEQLKYLLRRSGCFVFEKNGKYLLYRQGEAGDRNSLVLTDKDVNHFYRRVRKAVGV